MALVGLSGLRRGISYIYRHSGAVVMEDVSNALHKERRRSRRAFKTKKNERFDGKYFKKRMREIRKHSPKQVY